MPQFGRILNIPLEIVGDNWKIMTGFELSWGLATDPWGIVAEFERTLSGSWVSARPNKGD